MKNYLDATGLGEFAGQLADKLANSYASIFATKGEVGSPLSAATAADMTDTDRVYVYTGSETGYTAGDWYYYDGTEWQDGGVYNSVAVETDPTLAVEGMAADAKATGTALAAKLSGTDTTLSLSGMAADGKATGDALAAKLSGTDKTVSAAGEAADGKAAGEVLDELRALGLGTMSLSAVTINNWANRKVNPASGATSADNKYIYGRFSGTCDYIVVTGIPSGVDCALYGYAYSDYQSMLSTTYAGVEADFGATQETGTRIFRVTKGIAFALSCKNRNNTNIATSVGSGLGVYLVTAVTQEKEAAQVPDILTHDGTIIGRQFSWELGKIDTDGSVPTPPSSTSGESHKASWRQIRTAAYDCTPGDTYKIATRGIANEALIACMYYYDADAGTYTTVKRLAGDDAREFTVPIGVNRIRFANGRAAAAGGVYMTDPMDFINAFKVTVTTESINDYLDSIGYMPIHRVVKGSWQKNGSVSAKTKGISAYPVFDGLTVGSLIDVRINGNWCYSVWSGTTPTNLRQDYRLVQYAQFTVKRPYVAVSFYKLDANGQPVDTLVTDYDRNFLLFEAGTQAGNAEYREIPENLGVINVINRAYQMCKQSAVTVAPLPTQDDSYAGNVFPAGTVLQGTIYSSVRQRADYVPQCVNWQAYFTSITNEKSYIYTKQYSAGTDYNSRTYYGAVCSSMVSYCYGFENVIPTTYSFATKDGMHKVADQSAYGLNLGDCLISSKRSLNSGWHVYIVTAIVKDTRGYLRSVEICSQQTPWCKRMTKTAAEIQSLLNGDYESYRYEYIYKVTYTATPWVNLNDEADDPVYPTHILPLRGDTSNWYEGEAVEVYCKNTPAPVDPDTDPPETNYTSFRVVNVDDETVSREFEIDPDEDTYTIPDLVSGTGTLPAGRYCVKIGEGSGGVDYDEIAYFDVLASQETYSVVGTTVNVTFDTNEDNPLLTPASVVLCEANPADDDYRAVQAFHELTDDEAELGHCAWENVPAGDYLAAVFYKTEFGLWRCAVMQSVSV